MPKSINILGAALTERLPAKDIAHLQGAVSHVLMHYPGFIQALFQDCEIKWSTDVPVAALVLLPARRFEIHLNPVTLSKLTTPEIVFILCHEAMHRMLQHLPIAQWAKVNGVPITQAQAQALPQTQALTHTSDGARLPYNQLLLNIADDFIINYYLTQAGIGVQPVFDPATDITPGNAPRPVNPLTQETSSSDVYAALWAQAQQAQQAQQGQHNPLETYELDQAGQADQADQAGTDTPNQLKQAAAIAVKQAQRLQADTKAGKGAGMLGTLAELIDTSQVNWREELFQDIFSRNAKGADESWERVSRRHLAIGLTWPGRIGHQAGTVVCFHDTSGSVSEREAGMYYAEVAAALSQCNPEKIIILPVDTKVYDPVILSNDGGSAHLDFHSALTKVHAELKDKYLGGGGTSFNPGFVWVEENLLHERISQALYFTDGHGRCTVPAPTYPVTWVTTGDTKFPFGKVITLCD